MNGKITNKFKSAVKFLGEKIWEDDVPEIADNGLVEDNVKTETIQKTESIKPIENPIKESTFYNPNKIENDLLTSVPADILNEGIDANTNHKLNTASNTIQNELPKTTMETSNDMNSGDDAIQKLMSKGDEIIVPSKGFLGFTATCDELQSKIIESNELSIDCKKAKISNIEKKFLEMDGSESSIYLFYKQITHELYMASNKLGAYDSNSNILNKLGINKYDTVKATKALSDEKIRQYRITELFFDDESYGYLLDSDKEQYNQILDLAEKARSIAQEVDSSDIYDDSKIEDMIKNIVSNMDLSVVKEKLEFIICELHMRVNIAKGEFNSQMMA